MHGSSLLERVPPWFALQRMVESAPHVYEPCQSFVGLHTLHNTYGPLATSRAAVEAPYTFYVDSLCSKSNRTLVFLYQVTYEKK